MEYYRESGSGKTTALLELVEGWESVSAVGLGRCRTVGLAFREMEPAYSALLAAFPPTTRRIVTTTVPSDWNQRSFWTSAYTHSEDYSLVVLDDQWEQLNEKGSPLLAFLSHLLTVGLHHWRITILLLCQGTGSTDSSQKLRSLLRQFQVFIVFSGLNVTAVRWLGGFLLPGRGKFLNSCLETLPRRRGQFLFIDNRLEVPLRHKVATGKGLLSPDSVFVTFTQ